MLVAVLAGGCATNPGVIAREATPLVTADDQLVPVDPDVRILTLSNGLTVYLRSNDRPGGSAEMRLAINAGSAQEDPDQSGAAHFLEHMLFNGTTEFPANDLIATLRELRDAVRRRRQRLHRLRRDGLRAHRADQRVGQSGRWHSTCSGEWLSAATLDPEQVDREKGVVLDEWRQTRSITGRPDRQRLSRRCSSPAPGTRVTRRSDRTQAINAMTPDLLRRFYDTWYRPDNASIMVVGDIDVDEIEGADP